MIVNRWGAAVSIAMALVFFMRCYLGPFFWSALASRFIKSNDYAKAVDALDRALTFSPRDARLWLAKGVALRRLSKFDDALIALKEARRFAPDQLDIFQELVQLYRELGRYDESLALLDRSVELGLTPLSSLLMRCIIEIDAQRFQDAESNCSRLIATGSTKLASQAYSLRGIARLMLGRTEDSLADFETSYLLNPRSVETRVYCAATWLRRQMYRETVLLCDSILRDDPSNELADHIRGLAERASRLDERSDNGQKRRLS